MTRLSATEVRELESVASVRISSNGTFEISKMLRTGPVAGDARAPNNFELLAIQFDRRHDADVGAPVGQAIRALGRNGEGQIEQIALARRAACPTPAGPYSNN